MSFMVGLEECRDSYPEFDNLVDAGEHAAKIVEPFNQIMRPRQKLQGRKINKM